MTKIKYQFYITPILGFHLWPIMEKRPIGSRQLQRKSTWVDPGVHPNADPENEKVSKITKKKHLISPTQIENSPKQPPHSPPINGGLLQCF